MADAFDNTHTRFSDGNPRKGARKAEFFWFRGKGLLSLAVRTWVCFFLFFGYVFYFHYFKEPVADKTVFDHAFYIGGAIAVFAYMVYYGLAKALIEEIRRVFR